MNQVTAVGLRLRNKPITGDLVVDFTTPAGYVVDHFTKQVVDRP